MARGSNGGGALGLGEELRGRVGQLDMVTRVTGLDDSAPPGGAAASRPDASEGCQVNT